MAVAIEADPFLETFGTTVYSILSICRNMFSLDRICGFQQGINPRTRVITLTSQNEKQLGLAGLATVYIDARATRR